MEGTKLLETIINLTGLPEESLKTSLLKRADASGLDLNKASIDDLRPLFAQIAREVFSEIFEAPKQQ